RHPRCVRSHQPPQAVGREPPVVVRIAVDPEIERSRDHEYPARLEDSEDLVERSPHFKDMLERLDAEDGSRGGIRQVDGRDVLHPVHARTWPHVAADIDLARKHPPEIGVTFLPLDLKRAEFIHRGRTVEGLGHEAAECLVVVAHCCRYSMSRATGDSWSAEIRLTGSPHTPAGS